ncbi:hypothetical protein HN587_00065 [Candidatus Woesearchaeota archaeon]|jgi:hypothetical protein|nr:hypothetical protein [Candidatus Woesearchaeota archaeon]
MSFKSKLGDLFVFWSLGRFLTESDKRFAKSPLLVTVSKAEFVEYLLNTNFFDKQERALYKDLVKFEKSKLIAYKEKELRLTKKGLTLLMRIASEYDQLTDIKVKTTSQNIVKFSRSKQTKLSK